MKKRNLQLHEIVKDQLSIPAKLLTDYHLFGLHEAEVMLILQLLRFSEKNNDFPTPSELAHFVSFDEKQCAQILRKLLQQGLLTIEKNEQIEPYSESYSLEPLWEKLYTSKQENNEPEDPIGTIFILFEQEFGRPLSPFEIETINTWIDDDEIEPSLIKAGLRESVLMGKLNFKYIDRILREWKRKGIHSVQDARKASQPFHQNQQSSTPNQKRDTSFYYNWLEGE